MEAIRSILVLVIAYLAVLGLIYLVGFIRNRISARVYFNKVRDNKIPHFTKVSFYLKGDLVVWDKDKYSEWENINIRAHLKKNYDHIKDALREYDDDDEAVFY